MSAPPLPDIISFLESGANDESDAAPTAGPISGPITPLFRRLKAGCWLLHYNPINLPSVLYDGTFRVETVDGGLRASGDLYQRPNLQIPVPGQWPRTRVTPGPPPDPSEGIPILAINKYAFFLRATELIEAVSFGNLIKLGLEMYQYSHTAWNANPNIFPNWVATIPCTANMKWVPGSAPSGFPLPGSYLEGDVQDPTGKPLGKMTMGWVSEFLRKVMVEIDTVTGSEPPLDSGNGHDWSTIGAGMGYDLKHILSEETLSEITGDSWSNNEMHSAMVAHRDTNDLDKEWRYHILAVKNIDETPRGIMYDSEATDSNRVPREGVGISTLWEVPEGWGSSSGVRFGLAKAAHFRTAVHELGHALGLNRHNTIDLGFMNTSDAIASAGNFGPTPFPDNIKWQFADDDLRRLRHRSDMYIRPGGVQFKFINDSNPSQSADSSPLTFDSSELELKLTPLLAEVPIGAPVRVDLKLTNNGNVSLPVPARLDLKSNAIKGIVTDPSCTCRSFKSLIGCLDEASMVELAPKQSITKSLTLLRGGEGALFPMAGVSTITVQLCWSVPTVMGDERVQVQNHEVKVSAETTVFILSAHTLSHAKAAHKILTTPDMHLLIAFGGGEEPKRCEHALQEAFKCDVLAPHWAFFVAKEKARQGDRDVGGFMQIGARMIVSMGEKDKMERLLM